MRKCLLLFLLLSLTLQALAAQEFIDSYSFLKDLPLFSQFMEEAKNSGNFEKAKQLQNEILLHPVASLSQTEQTVLEIKTATVLARMCTELEVKELSFAKELLDNAEAKADSLPKDSLFAYCSFADIYGTWYLVSSFNLAKGLASSKQIDKAYKTYPAEVSVILLKANSLLFAPSFSQKEVKNALSMFLLLLDQTQETLAPWDLASLYSGIGIACYKLGDTTNAEGYLKAAKAIYAFDKTLDGYLKNLE
jgi:tetratricopeptide (TPR) repeat protein